MMLFCHSSHNIQALCVPPYHRPSAGACGILQTASTSADTGNRVHVSFIVSGGLAVSMGADNYVNVQQGPLLVKSSTFTLTPGGSSD